MNPGMNHVKKKSLEKIQHPIKPRPLATLKSFCAHNINRKKHKCILLESLFLSSGGQSGGSVTHINETCCTDTSGTARGGRLSGEQCGSAFFFLINELNSERNIIRKAYSSLTSHFYCVFLCSLTDLLHHHHRSSLYLPWSIPPPIIHSSALSLCISTASVDILTFQTAAQQHTCPHTQPAARHERQLSMCMPSCHAVRISLSVCLSFCLLTQTHVEKPADYRLWCLDFDK